MAAGCTQLPMSWPWARTGWCGMHPFFPVMQGHTEVSEVVKGRAREVTPGSSSAALGSPAPPSACMWPRSGNQGPERIGVTRGSLGERVCNMSVVTVLMARAAGGKRAREGLPEWALMAKLRLELTLRGRTQRSLTGSCPARKGMCFRGDFAESPGVPGGFLLSPVGRTLLFPPWPAGQSPLPGRWGGGSHLWAGDVQGAWTPAEVSSLGASQALGMS